jgi:predicted naringenin-chalcone synthase
MRRYERHAPALAAAAARDALAEAGLDPREVTHLVTASCTGFSAPGVDCALVDVLGLPRSVLRTHVGFMGCHGGLNALRVADAFAGADAAARVLVAAVEISSVHLRAARDPSSLVSASLFADGAGAIVGAAGDGPFRVAATGSLIPRDTATAMGWRIGDRGFEMDLDPEVPGLVEAHARPWLAEWLGGRGLAPEDVGSFAVHPGGPRILDAVERSLGLDRAALRVSRDVLAEHGNMSSATFFFVLERLRSAGAPRPVLGLGFGPGLTIEAALLD